MNDFELLQRLERYLDSVPRHASRVESFGGLTLFAKIGDGWPYYARPTVGVAEMTLAVLEEVRERQRKLGIPEAVEWVDETTPSLRPIVERSGMSIHGVPLMVLREPLQIVGPDGAEVRVLRPEDPHLAPATAVADIGFATPGTGAGTAGPTERDAAAAEIAADRLAFLRERIRTGLTVTAAAVDTCVGPLSVGSHQPVDSVTEIVAVATLPSARRRGLAAAVTARLIADAKGRGITTVFLSADSAEVARMYSRLGFERVGTSCIAEAQSS